MTRSAPRWLVLAAACLWGTTGTTQALALPELHPAAVGAVRIGIGALGLLALAGTGIRAGRPWPPAATLAAGLSVAANQTFFFASVRQAGVAMGTVVTIGSAPIAAGLLGYVVRGERPGPRWAVATALAVGGAGLLLTPGQGAVQPIGVLFGLVAGFAYAGYTVAAKGLLDRRPPAAVMALTFGLAALLLLPALVTADLRPLASPGGAVAALHLGLVTVTLAYLLFGRGLAGIPVATAATLTLAEPLTAGLLGVTLLQERLGVSAWLGALLILAGLALVASPGPSRRPRRPY